MRVGSLFSGYGGLDLAVKAVWPDAETVFVADVCKVGKDGTVGHREPCGAPCSILAHRFPGVPNLGDVARIDWSAWASRIDILLAGFPCQDVSTAGRRAGLMDGTRTGLWFQVVRAIRDLNPRLVVLENVPGIFTAPAAGDVEPCPWCVGDEPDGSLRALDAVLADLATLGLDAEWITVPASGVGAPHKRERWFCVAHAPGDSWRIGDGDDGAAADTSGPRLGQHGRGASPQEAGSHQGHQPRRDGSLLPTRATDGTKGGPGQRGSSGDLMLPSAVALLPTPVAAEGTKPSNTMGVKRRQQTGEVFLTNAIVTLCGLDPTEQTGALLPTPAVNDMGEGKAPERWDEWTADMQARHGNGNDHGKSLAIEAQRLLPTPTSQDSAASGGSTPADVTLTDAVVRTNLGSKENPRHAVSTEARAQCGQVPQPWGIYADAIARWERVLGRPAPEPTQTSTKGNPQLSPRFVEFLMGLPAGWVTAVPGITRNEALKALGNGVVPQQGAAAIRWLLSVEAVA